MFHGLIDHRTNRSRNITLWMVPRAIWAAVLTLVAFNVASSQTYLPPIANGPTSSEAGIVLESAMVLQELATGTVANIPEYLLREAHGIAVIPHYVRGAFVIGVAGGRGVLVLRDAHGNWQAPEFITMGGGSIGWQAGVQATDLVLVFRSPRSLTNIRQGKLTLGADASAAAGPVGRFASASTDTRLQAEILTYSRSRGLFAGVSLSGASLQMDIPATQRYYQIQPNGAGVVPQSAVAFVNELNRFTPRPPTPAQPSGFGIESAPQLDANHQAVLPNAGAFSTEPLQQSVAQLQAKVDNQWKQYLALSPAMLAGQAYHADEIHSMLIRYERVATNPQFVALRSQPEFQQSLEILRRMSAEAVATKQLALPAPPAGEAPGGYHGRY